jgi:aldose 1-epimerase
MTEHSNDIHELRAGALRLAVRADLGGSIAGLWHGDAPLMRSTEPGALPSSRRSASYPLVPYSNRIGHRHFRWQGREHTTQANFDDNPHSVHGVGWLRPWRQVSSSPGELVLVYTHVPDGHWPFAFEARQHFTLTPQQLGVRLVFENTADVDQPVGLGWHPYFPKRAQSRLHIEVAERWESGADELPTRCVAQRAIDGAVADLDFDNCFGGWRGAAQIRDEAFSMRLTSSEHYLVVYTPREKEYFCVEPVSHVSNAIQMDDPAAHGLRTVPPGRSTEAWMQLEVSPP